MTLIASIASDMFVGRERFATILLMRLTETVILWLSDDQNFWEEIEEGPRPLGPLGLQQVFHFSSTTLCVCVIYVSNEDVIAFLLDIYTYLADKCLY